MNQNEQEDTVIQFSARLAETLSNKVEKHNENCPQNKVKTSQVIKVYKHAIQAFSQESLVEVGINKWCLARVNMYLRMKCGDINAKSVENKPSTKRKMSSLILEKSVSKRINTFLDVTEGWTPKEKDFSQAQEDVVNYGLDYEFKTSEEIYFAERDLSEGLDFNYS